MNDHDSQPHPDTVLETVTGHQLKHFTEDTRCRGVQLPDGLMLRYNLSRSLYFYLRSGVRDGRLSTRIFASDSPYDPQKTNIGEVLTPMFEPDAEKQHLKKIERLLGSWVGFVSEVPDEDQMFQTFEMNKQYD